MFDLKCLIHEQTVCDTWLWRNELKNWWNFCFQMQRILDLDKVDVSETEFCKIKNNSIRRLVIDDKSLAIHLIADEILLSTQFPDEDLTGFLNLIRILVTKTTDEENEKAFVSFVIFKLY